MHHIPYKTQPKKQMGKITNDLKKSYPQFLPVTKILESFAKGHSIILSNAEIDEKDSFRFISSRLFAIDVDDDHKETIPEEVLFRLKDKLVGLFFTFSHGIKGNRYRLLFQLDQTINDQSQMRAIIELVATDLHAMGLPVDLKITHPLQVVRGGKSYQLVNENNKLNTQELLERVKKEQAKRQHELYEGLSNLTPINFEALKEMAETIGYLPSGDGYETTQLWKRLIYGIKHYANAGFITQEEGFQLFDIISGGEQSQKAWERLKPRGEAKIGSLVNEAKKRGYKGKYYHYTNEQEITKDYNEEEIKVKRYLPVEVAKEIILRKQRILIDSPTGSGKTTSFLDAFKELATERNHFYIFSAPTIALTEQNSLSHKIRAVKGETKNLFKMINQDVKSGKRIFIATYDMTPRLIEFLRLIEKNITFTLVVDELHKFITDYNYRYDAIRKLNEISQQAISFIGLSGTIDDIYKNEFDTVIRINNGNPQSPCQEFAVYMYDKKDNALAELAQLIEVWTTRRKLLVYIQNKKKIEYLKNVLRRKGIKVRTINASSKSNNTYKQLIESETVDNDVQVVLTTSVIADGVNIQNDMEWEVIAVSNDFSNLFNYSAIKQISNRLRNPYRRFSLFMQEPKNNNQDLFSLDAAYNRRRTIAERILKEINNHAYFDPQLFRASQIERLYGIYLSFEKHLAIDTLYLRHSVSQEQSRYFAGARYAFVRATEKALHIKQAGILNISKEIAAKSLDLAFTQQVLKELEEIDIEKELAKKQTISSTFTREVYDYFVNDEQEHLNRVKKDFTDTHYACLSKLTKIADYETCKKIVSSIERAADTHHFYNHIRYLTETIYLYSVNRPNKTRKVLDLLLEINEFVTSEEYQKLVEKISKKTKLQTKDIKTVEKMVVFETSRNKKDRFKKVTSLITVDHIAKTFKIPSEQVKKVALNYAERQTKTFHTVIKSKLI